MQQLGFVGLLNGTTGSFSTFARHVWDTIQESNHGKGRSRGHAWLLSEFRDQEVLVSSANVILVCFVTDN